MNLENLFARGYIRLKEHPTHKYFRKADNMNCSRKDLLLYAVTDRSWLNGRTLYEQAEEALKGGVTLLQLREKELSEQEFLEEAAEMKKLCARYHVPLIINDQVEIARKIDADGVHVGQSDMEASQARAVLGPHKIIGVSVKTVEQALLAQKQGADYLGCGAAFPTGTKQDTAVISHEQLRAVCEAVTIPVAAIGGITKDNLAGLKGCGISGIAVVSAIFAQKDIMLAAQELKKRAAEIA